MLSSGGTSHSIEAVMNPVLKRGSMKAAVSAMGM
jgi:hypothetical protein